MSHTLQAVAWTLIHFCWQAAAIAVLYRGLSLGLAQRSSNIRYVAALSALLLMLGAAVATFAWESRPSAARALAAADLSDGAAHVGYTISPTTTPVTDTARPASPPSPFFPVLSPATLLWIDALWLVGVATFSLRSAGGWWVIQKLRRTATVEASAAAIEAFNRIAQALGLSRPVLLRVSSAIAGPVTVGTLHALVLLPLTAATSLSPEELEVVFAHELAHVRRADFLWNLVQTFIETLFFFHPAVWWVGNRIRHERELCCDDLALTVCPDPLIYARALFHLEEQRGHHWQLSSRGDLAMALDGHQSRQTLRMRIARILGEPFTQTARRGPFSIAAAAALLVVLMMPVPQVLASLDPPKPAAVNAVLTGALVRPPVATARAAASAIHALVAGARPAITPIAPAPGSGEQQNEAAPAQQPTPPPAGHKGDYIDQMRAAGYDVDLDKLVAMKVQDVTPEYAREMSQLGLGKLTADQLIACKIQDVTADYIAKMKAAGYSADIDKYVAMKIQDVTPEYAEKMAQLGFGKLSADDLIAARIQDVTPEYLAQLKHDGLEVKTMQDAIQYRIFNVTPEFIAQMKAAGFGDLTHQQLMALRVQDVTPEYARAIRQQYPGATVDDIVKTRIFNINAEFIADAKRHGFNDLTLDKLVKLRISGILDDESDSK